MALTFVVLKMPPVMAFSSTKRTTSGQSRNRIDRAHMTNEYRRYLLFGLTGIVAGVLLQPFLRGSVNSPGAVYAIAPGLIFALCMTVAAISAPRSHLQPRRWLRYALGAAVLIVGMPVAFLVGGRSQMMVDGIMTGGNHFGGHALSFVLREIFTLGGILSCVVWSFVITAWALIVTQSSTFRIMRTAIVVTCSILICANLIEILSKSLWQRSWFVTVVSFGEIIGSALVLANGWPGSSEEMAN